LSTSSQKEIDKDEIQLNLPSNLGRLYGKIARDRNPIHLYPWSAKLFGFKKPIIHGMWTLARTLATITPADQCTLGSLEVRFKRPISLPSTCSLNQWKTSGESTYFDVLTEEEKTAIAGSILLSS
jgi:acyl dehydratase